MPLWHHQKYTVDKFRSLKGGLDMSDPGTGKTSAALALYAQRPGRGRALVLCPSTLMESAWANDIDKFYPQLTYTLAYANTRFEAFETDSDIVIMNVDGVKSLIKKFPRQPQLQKFLRDFDHCIMDEIEAFKHPGSQRSKAARVITRMMDYNFGLSATPNPQSVTELWHPSLLVDGGKRLGTSFTAFRNSMQTPIQVGPQANHLRWEDKPQANEIAMVLLDDILVRHAFDEVMTDVPPNHTDTKYVTLPPKLRKQYEELRHVMCLLLDSGKVLSVPHASSLRSKLLQACCIEKGTEVLTARGWTPIEQIKSCDLVWDGIEWVTTLGAIYSGFKQTVTLDGIAMTPDHRVMTVSGWQEAQDIIHGNADARFDRAQVRLPDSVVSSRPGGEQMYALDDTMYMRKESHPYRNQPTQQKQASAQIMRLPSWQTISSCARIAWACLSPALQSLDKNRISLLQHLRQGLSQLRRAWDNSVRTLATLVPQLLSRYGRLIQGGAYIGAHQQQPWLFTKELPLGNCTRTKQQHSQQRAHTDTERCNDDRTNGASLQFETGNSISPVSRRRPVYDVAEAGPRHRFVIRSTTGTAMIVHNSGALYAPNDVDGAGDYAVLDTFRYAMIADLVEERQHSVVFFNWRHQKHELAAQLKKRGVSFEVIDGGVAQRKRPDIVKRYQAGEFRTLLVNYKTGAHGLTLTRGTTSIICSPIYEPNYFKQTIHRIYRGGQTEVTNTLLVCAKDTVEELVYEKLRAGTLRMENFLALVAQSKFN